MAREAEQKGEEEARVEARVAAAMVEARAADKIPRKRGTAGA